MIDWTSYRAHLAAGVSDLAKLTPDTVRAYGMLSAAGTKTGQLDDRIRELIALGVAISLRCDGCIAVHSQAALKAGATGEELAEALGVAISVNAGAALVFATRAMDAFETAGS